MTHRAKGQLAAIELTDGPDVSPPVIAALVAAGVAALRESALTEATDLLTEVTHDMRSPLSSMLVLIEQLRSGRSGPLSPAQEHQLGLLYNATFELSGMTNDALDSARGTDRLFASAASTFSMAEVMRSVRDLVQPIAEDRGLQLRCSGPTVDERVGQPSVLHRILLNLTTNALKFTSRGGTVSMNALPIGDHRICFSVVDSGRGLPDSILHALAGSSAGHEPVALPGFGLGLKLCRQLLAESGSELVAEPVMPCGTRMQFTLDLPSS